MQKLSDKYDVKLLCELQDLPRSSYYYVPVVRDDSKLRCAIQQTCLRHIRYGYRRVTPIVKKKHKVGKDRVSLKARIAELERELREKDRSLEQAREAAQEASQRHDTIVLQLTRQLEQRQKLLEDKSSKRRRLAFWRRRVFGNDEPER